jgi:plastocyanin
VRYRLIVTSLLVLVGVACGSSGPAKPLPPNTVRAANFSFTPATLTVAVGTTVTWEIDEPDAPHNVVSLSGPLSFNSGDPVGRGTFRFTFTKSGTYTYECSVHTGMTGTIVVTAT